MNITGDIINLLVIFTKENVESDDCIGSVNFTSDIHEQLNLTTINGLVIVCDVEEKNMLLTAYNDYELEKDIVNIAGNVTVEIIVKDVDFDGQNKAKDDMIWIILISVGIFIVFCIVMIMCLLRIKISRERMLEKEKENIVNSIPMHQVMSVSSDFDNDHNTANTNDDIVIERDTRNITPGSNALVDAMDDEIVFGDDETIR